MGLSLMLYSLLCGVAYVWSSSALAQAYWPSNGIAYYKKPLVICNFSSHPLI